MEKLRLKRKEFGYTIYDMAKFLSISASFYSQIENNKRRLYYDMAVRISSLFNMKPDDIFYTDSLLKNMSNNK